MAQVLRVVDHQRIVERIEKFGLLPALQPEREQMSKADDGGPAFARSSTEDNDCHYCNEQDGMSLRDYFAAHAPDTITTDIVDESDEDRAVFIGIPEKEYHCPVHYPMVDAKARYIWADAMLEARKQ